RLRSPTGDGLIPGRGVDAGGSSSPATYSPPSAMARPAALPRSAAPPAASKNAVEARLTANPQLRVIEASARCADLIGARPDALIGEHLIDAIPDREVGDEVMRCLGALAAAGEQRTSVAPVGKPHRLSILMTRAGKDQPITITFRTEEGN